MNSLLVNYPATIEVTQLGAQVPRGKQEKDMQLRSTLRLAVGSGNITFSATRSTHLPHSSLPHRSKISNCVSLVETHLYREHFSDRTASLHAEADLSAVVV